MAKTLNQIVKSLNSVYSPQVKSIRTRQSLIPGQTQAEEEGLTAKQDLAFNNILGGARQRGLGFSGIPLGEQAKYTATEYMPALARLRQSAREQEMSLEDAILGIRERQNTQGQSLFENYKQRRLQRDQMKEDRRQFNETMKFNRQEAARSRRSGGGSSVADPSILGGLLGGLGGGGGSGGDDGKTGINKDRAYSAVKQLLGTKDRGLIRKTYNAIQKSASYGNKYDKYKLKLIRSMYKTAPKTGQWKVAKQKSKARSPVNRYYRWGR